MTKQFLLASDFDQTLSFNDSGVVLSELIGFNGFHDKVKGLAEMNLVQQGAELSYLILHDPDFRRVRREHLVEAGKRIRLKNDVALFARALDNLSEGYKFHFNVISAAPQEIIQSALEGIVPADHIFGTRFRYNEASGEVDSIIRASAGWGKITVLEELRSNGKRCAPTCSRSKIPRSRSQPHRRPNAAPSHIGLITQGRSSGPPFFFFSAQKSSSDLQTKIFASIPSKK